MNLKIMFLPIAAAVFALHGHQDKRAETAAPTSLEIRTIVRAYTWDGTALTNSECHELPIDAPELKEVLRELQDLEVKMQALHQERMRVLEQMINLKEELARTVPTMILPPMPSVPVLDDLPVACAPPATPVRIERPSGTARG